MDVANLTGRVNAAAQQGVLTADDVHDFTSGNLAKKREIASKGEAVNALMAQQFLQNKQSQQMGMEGERLQLAKDTLDREHPADFQPGATIPVKDAAGNVTHTLVQVSPGGWNALPTKKTIDAADPDSTPLTTKVDPVTKKSFYWDSHFNAWKPVTDPSMMSALINGAALQTPAVQTPAQPAPSSWRLMHPSTWGGGGAPAAPVVPTRQVQPAGTPPPSTGGQAGVAIPAQAAAFLRQNPGTAATFDTKYGQGAAQRVLGQ